MRQGGPSHHRAMQPPLHAKPVIVCADDFALSEAVSAAIAQLATQGRLGATSAMVLSPRWGRDAALLQGVRERIGVGLHLDWTSPLAIGAGHGLSLAGAMARSLSGGFDAAKVTGVIERQLDAFEAQWKSAPDHVDGHQHVHQFAGIRQPLLEVLDRRYGRGAGPSLRISRPLGAGLKGRVVAAMGANALESALGESGRPASPALVGMYGFEGTEADYAARVDGWLRDAPAGAILMCHPATRAEPDDPIGPARVREFEFWRSDAASESLARWNAAPVPGPAPRPCAR
jgi:predicted glycoside hydrolase/deacetylase ChbG (UPF0249 family)